MQNLFEKEYTSNVILYFFGYINIFPMSRYEYHLCMTTPEVSVMEGSIIDIMDLQKVNFIHTALSERKM